MTLISPGDCTRQCGMWLWDHDSEFTKWQHPAMWHVALESWHRIRQVAAPCSVAGGSRMTRHWIRPNVRHIGILHLLSIFSTTSSQSTCHSAPVSEILSKSDHPREKKMTSCRFSRWRISAILDFRRPVMVLWKAHVRLPIGRHRHRSSKLLTFWENRVFLHFGDRHAGKQTNRWTGPMH